MLLLEFPSCSQTHTEEKTVRLHVLHVIAAQVCDPPSYKSSTGESDTLVACTLMNSRGGLASVLISPTLLCNISTLSEIWSLSNIASNLKPAYWNISLFLFLAILFRTSETNMTTGEEKKRKEISLETVAGSSGTDKFVENQRHVPTRFADTQ